MEPKFTIQLKILKPVAEVFDAIVDPRKLSGYFTKSADAPLSEGGTARWRFAEIDDEVTVEVAKMRAPEHIVLHWPAHESAGCDNVAGDYQTRVDIRLQPLDGGATLLSISESGWRDNDAARAGSYSNCSGWMHMACCLKAYLEYGVNLREGGAI